MTVKDRILTCVITQINTNIRTADDEGQNTGIQPENCSYHGWKHALQDSHQKSRTMTFQDKSPTQKVARHPFGSMVLHVAVLKP
jgi:hypothetical protein